MNLPLPTEQLLHGCVRLGRLGNAPVPRRHSLAQEALLVRDPVWPRCARGCSGVQVALRTDATWADLRLRVWGDVRPRLGLDVEIDGAWHSTWREGDSSGVIERRVFDLKDNNQRIMRTIRVHLPLGLEVAIEGLVLPSEARCDCVPDRPRRLLCLGDSITQGHAAGSPAATWASLAARRWDAELLNQGIAGHIWDPAYLAEVPLWQPDAVVVAYGINDWSRGEGGEPGAIAHRVSDGLTALRPRIGSAPVLVLTPTWCTFATTPRHGAILEDIRQAIAAAALAAGATVLDGSTILPPEPWWFADGLHPNDAGMSLIAARVADRLATL